MAIQTYVDENGVTCYRIRCKATSPRVKPVQKQLRLGAVSHAEAQAEHNKLKRVVAAELLERERNGITWGIVLDAWYRRDVLKSYHPTTTKSDNYNALTKYTRGWVHTPVDRLAPIDVQVIFRDMERVGLSKGRMKTVKGAINTVFDWAKLERLIPTHVQSPARGARLPKVESKKPEALSFKEIRLFLQKAQELKHPYYYLWAVAFNTGCRSGELMALRWKDIDLDRKMITVSKSFTIRFAKDKSTKSGEWREVPINLQLERLLKELRLVTGTSEHVLPRITSWMRGEAARVTRDFCQAIGVREINFHATRACFAIQCLQNGIGMVKAMKLGGWKDIKSFQHYVRLAGVEIEGATDSFDLIPEPSKEATVHQLPAKSAEG